MDLHRQAVVGKDYLPQVAPAFVTEVGGDEPTVPDSGAAGSDSDEGIVLTQYAPNELHYQFRAQSPALAVFSEVFHPIGWKARIQYHPASPETAAASALSGVPALPVSEELPLLRANWLLRAAQLPAGEGEIVMRYEPEDYVLGANISRASSILLYLLLLLSLGLANYSRKQ